MDKKDKDHNKEIKKLNTGFTEKLIDKEFSATFHSYTLGDKYNEPFFKKSLRDQIREDVLKVAKLTLSDNGDVIPKNPENIDMELFIQNKPVNTLKDVMDPLMASHIKVNNVDPKKPKDGYIQAKEVKLSVQAQEFIERREKMKMN